MIPRKYTVSKKAADCGFFTDVSIYMSQGVTLARFGESVCISSLFDIPLRPLGRVLNGHS